jgi:hypothetical protein
MSKCYKCIYRGNVPGDAHSCCRYPGNDPDLFTGLFSLKNAENAKKLNITADPHGIRSGWFLWPVNFDPVWLLTCDGFKI